MACAQELELRDTGLGAAGCGVLGEALFRMERLKRLLLGYVEKALWGREMCVRRDTLICFSLLWFDHLVTCECTVEP